MLTIEVKPEYNEFHKKILPVAYLYRDTILISFHVGIDREDAVIEIAKKYLDDKEKIFTSDGTIDYGSLVEIIRAVYRSGLQATESKIKELEDTVFELNSDLINIKTGRSTLKEFKERMAEGPVNCKVALKDIETVNYRDQENGD